MKKLLILVLCIVLNGCQTTPFYINEAIKAKQRNYSDKLPNLEAIYENENTLKVFSTQDSFIQINTPKANKFYREVEKNLINPISEKKGYIVLKPIFSETNDQEIQEQQDLLLVAAIYTLGLLPLIFNVPKVTYKGFSELEARILDNNGRIIKKYSAEYTAKIQHSTRNQCQNCTERVEWEAYSGALDDIIEQIYNDRSFLKKELNSLN